MNTNEFMEWLGDAISCKLDEENFNTGNPSNLERTETYEERGYLTREKGIVLVFENNDEFHITITKTKGKEFGLGFKKL